MIPQTSPGLTSDETRGIFAGNGAFPSLLAEALKRSGARVVAAGIAGETRPELTTQVDDFALLPLGALKRAADFFKEHRAYTIYFAGGVSRSALLRRARPDLMALKVALMSLTRGDDRLLRNVATCFETHGLKVADPTPHIGPLLAGAGHIAGPWPTDAILSSLRAARRAALTLGEQDRGQAALALGESVVALEDKRGTDALMARAPGSGAVLAKMVKPNQDRRFDLPAIGPTTITRARDFGLAAVGIEAGGTLILERQKVSKACDRFGISLMSFTSAKAHRSDGGCHCTLK